MQNDFSKKKTRFVDVQKDFSARKPTLVNLQKAFSKNRAKNRYIYNKVSDKMTKFAEPTAAEDVNRHRN